MTAVTITPSDNGPYLVSGPVAILDSDGQEGGIDASLRDPVEWRLRDRPAWLNTVRARRRLDPRLVEGWTALSGRAERESSVSVMTNTSAATVAVARGPAIRALGAALIGSDA